MYKVLIADDEALEREAIRYLLNSGRYEDLELLECSNGKDALRMILAEKPDIAILDIQMPGFTGLEVLAKIREMGYSGKTVFLTAYDSFDYAVKALKLHAEDYIVKPITESAFFKLIDRLLDELGEEEADREIRLQRNELLKNMEKTYLKKMILGDIDEEVMNFMQIQGFPMEVSGTVVCVKFLDELPDGQVQKIREEVREKAMIVHEFAMVNLQNQMMTAIYFSNVMEPDPQGDLQRMLEKYFRGLGLRFVFETGTVFEDLSGVEESYNAAREKIGDIRAEKRAQVQIREDDAARAAADADGGEIPAELMKVKKYMEQNYGKKIGLNELADVAGFTKYYLSRLYKKYYNENIMDCLIRLRMDKAKELLEKSELSVKQISMQVGFTEPNYFTWAFKKINGETPLKYRQEHKAEQESESWNF